MYVLARWTEGIFSTKIICARVRRARAYYFLEKWSLCHLISFKTLFGNILFFLVTLKHEFVLFALYLEKNIFILAVGTVIFLYEIHSSTVSYFKCLQINNLCGVSRCCTKRWIWVIHYMLVVNQCKWLKKNYSCSLKPLLRLPLPCGTNVPSAYLGEVRLDVTLSVGWADPHTVRILHWWLYSNLYSTNTVGYYILERFTQCYLLSKYLH